MATDLTLNAKKGVTPFSKACAESLTIRPALKLTLLQSHLSISSIGNEAAGMSLTIDHHAVELASNQTMLLMACEHMLCWHEQMGSESVKRTSDCQILSPSQSPSEINMSLP